MRTIASITADILDMISLPRETKLKKAHLLAIEKALREGNREEVERLKVAAEHWQDRASYWQKRYLAECRPTQGSSVDREWLAKMRRKAHSDRAVDLTTAKRMLDEMVMEINSKMN